MYNVLNTLTGALVPGPNLCAIVAPPAQESEQRSDPLGLVYGLLYAAGMALAVAIAIGLLLWWWLTRRSDREGFRQGTGTSPRAEIRLPAKVRTPEAAPAPVSALPVEAPTARREAEPPAPDDLKRIRGIGPKIAGLLQSTGVQTYAQLATTGVDRLRETLAEEGLARLADPTSWPEQARLAAEGKWGALKALQEELKAGR
jgi:predicted flap endonuclease-1-like 5' DNA nuclease